MSKRKKATRPVRLDIADIMQDLYEMNRGAEVQQERVVRQRAVDGITVNGMQLEIKTERQSNPNQVGENEHIAKAGARAGQAKRAFNSEREALLTAAQYGNHNPEAAYICRVCGKWHLG